MGYRIGIDIGGTFTDFAVLKGSDLILHKNLSTPADRSIGVMTGLAIVAERQGLRLSDFLGQCDALVHATTIADNTLIEMNGALTGLITTAGFRRKARCAPADHAAAAAAHRAGACSFRRRRPQAAR
jgi:N-methylhydantoinase A